MPTRRKNRILFFAKAFPPNPGGVERYSLDLALAFRDLGCSPVVITQREGPAGLGRRDGLPVYNVGPGGQAVVFIRMLLAAMGVRRGRNFAFTYTTTWRVALPALCTMAPRPIGCTIHGREAFVPKGAMQRLMKWVLNRADHLFAISQFTLDESLRRGLLRADKVVRNWNGFTPPVAARDAQNAETPDGEPIQLFTICRLVARKNLDGAIRALALLRREGRLENVVYHVAGDGEERTRLERLVEDEGLTDVVRLWGRVSDQQKIDLYHAADVFLHPQVALLSGDDAEGFGLVIAEAMAYGLPVLAGQEGGTADFVVDGDTGRVVDGRSDRAIADAIAALVASPEDRRRYAEAGRDWVLENLGWDRHAATILGRCLPSHASRLGAAEPADSPRSLAARC